MPDIFFTNFLNKYSIKDPSVTYNGNPSIGRAELIHTDGRIDMAKLTGALRTLGERPYQSSVAYRGGGLGCSNPPPEIPKALQNRAKLKPYCENLKIAEFRTPTPQDVRKKGSKILKLPRFAIVLH